MTKQDGSKQLVTQLHFIGWPDHGIPNDKSRLEGFEMTLNEFITWNLKSSDDEKGIVHCSAGIGRTGTTIALAETIINIAA